jgi:phage terminase small subunit
MAAVPTPRHLSRRSKAIFRAVVDDYALEREPHAVAILRQACEAIDRAEQARRRIEQDGAYLPDRFGQLKPHPALAVERDAKTLTARLLRELSLGDQFIAETRLPRTNGALN